MKKLKKFFQRVKNRRKRVAITFVLLITFLASFFYLFKLDTIPSGFHGDEAELSLFSLKILQGKVKNLIGVGQHNHPILSFLPQVVTMGFFGVNIFGARLASALIGIITVPVFYFFVRKIWSQRVAFFATTLFATSHWIIAINRLAINNNQTMLLGILSFWIILKALESEENFFYLLAGGFSALSLYLYAGAKIFPLITLVLFINNGLKKRREKFFKYLKGLLLFGIAFFLIALPQAMFFVKNQPSVTSRFKSIYVFGAGSQWWGKSHYQDKNDLEIFWLQTKKTFDLSPRGSDTCGQYGYQGRIFNLFFLIVLVTGIALSLTNLKKNEFLLLLLWLLLPLLFGQILMVDPFAFPRAVPAFPSLFILAGVGIEFFWQKINSFPRKKEKLILFSLPILALCFTVLSSLNIYFILSEKTGFGDPNKYVATKIANYLNSFDSKYKIIFLTAPSLYADFAPIRFLAPQIKPFNVKRPSQYQPTTLNRETIFVIYPDYFRKLEEITLLNPEGQLITEYNQKQQIQFYLYKIEP